MHKLPAGQSRPAIILVEPQHPGNVGMVARAMANFGASELRLVNPCDHLAFDARKFSLHAFPLLEEAKLYPDLASALADLHLSVATTRRSGENRRVPLILSDLPQQLNPAAGRCGIVFGREDTGLTSAEVALCSLGVTIPTDPAFASLNLAQAVGIVLYELSRESVAIQPPCGAEQPTNGEMEELFRQMEETLARIAFFKSEPPEIRMNRLRRIYRRANLDLFELNLLRGLWDQLGWSIRDWSGRKKVK